MPAKSFDWSKEINEVITNSLITTFGLDFLLLEDKKGGDVNTINNVRKGIWATEKEEEKYKTREEYNSNAYHQHTNYKLKNKQDAEKHSRAELEDAYRNEKFKSHRNNRHINLDHVVSAYEIHNDAGRVLAEQDGINLANNSSNLCSTGETINKVKKAHSVDHFLNDTLQKSISSREYKLANLKQQLNNMSRNTKEQQHKYRELENKLEIEQNKLEELKQIDRKKIKEADKNARSEYNKKISSYYTSSKFLKESLSSAGTKGFQMGLRESLGIIFAEIWFELKISIPNLYKKYKNVEFNILGFLQDLKNTILEIIKRVKLRFNDIIKSFKNGAISGLFSSLTTTITNIFLTTAKFWGKIIRESWLNLIKVIKIIFFNPENLSTGEIAKATFKIISVSIGTLVGVIINESLITIKTLPFGDEIVTFLSALSSGIIILGMNYFIENSKVMQDLWVYLDRIKTKYEKTVDHFKDINKELDKYVLELTRLEFGIDVNNISKFSQELTWANNEIERSIVIKKEIEQQDISLPFTIGDKESTRDWLLGLTKK